MRPTMCVRAEFQRRRVRRKRCHVELLGLCDDRLETPAAVQVGPAAHRSPVHGDLVAAGLAEQIRCGDERHVSGGSMIAGTAATTTEYSPRARSSCPRNFIRCARELVAKVVIAQRPDSGSGRRVDLGGRPTTTKTRLGQGVAQIVQLGGCDVAAPQHHAGHRHVGRHMLEVVPTVPRLDRISVTIEPGEDDASWFHDPP